MAWCVQKVLLTCAIAHDATLLKYFSCELSFSICWCVRTNFCIITTFKAPFRTHYLNAVFHSFLSKALSNVVSYFTSTALTAVVFNSLFSEALRYPMSHYTSTALTIIVFHSSCGASQQKKRTQIIDAQVCFVFVARSCYLYLCLALWLYPPEGNPSSCSGSYFFAPSLCKTIEKNNQVNVQVEIGEW